MKPRPLCNEATVPTIVPPSCPNWPIVFIREKKIKTETEPIFFKPAHPNFWTDNKTQLFNYAIYDIFFSRLDLYF